MSANLKHPLPFCLATLAILAVMFAPTQSKADTVYTSLSSFNAATTGNTTITFNGIAAPGGFVAETSPATFAGATFSTTSSLFVIDPGFYGFSYSNGGFLNADFQQPDVITVTLPSVTAVGFDFGGLFGATGPYLVTLSDGFSTSLSSSGSAASDNLSFVGFTSSTPLTSITLTLPDAPEYNAIDNFVYASAVPEPGTLGLLATGLLGVAGGIRRRLQN
jgi:hypothetical protein